MRIAYLADHGSVHTRRWVRWFAERGHEVHVVTCGGGDVVDLDERGELLPRPWSVHDLGAPRGGKAGYLAKAAAARRVLRMIDPDVVHVHWLTSYGLLGLASRPRVPVVVTAHGCDLNRSGSRWPMRSLVRAVLRAADLATVPSHDMRLTAEALLGDDADAPEITVFQYGVETTRLAALGRRARARRAARPDRSVRVVSTRPLEPLYRIELLLDAADLLVEDGWRVQVDVYGDGPSRGALERRATAGRASVDFHGAVAPPEVEQAIARADVFASIADTDGASISLLEAMAIGTPAVVSDIPANRTWIADGSTGAVVGRDAAAVADGIVRATSLDVDRVARDGASLVAEIADRDVNLAGCESMMDELAGVRWDPTPRSGDTAA